jgi:tetratricopeptide (TPR) repeat protein
MPDENRVAALKEILDTNPDDAFARYALGLEYSGSGDTDAALAEFQRLLASHPDYTNGYFMAAQTLARAERKEDAQSQLRQGIECARRTRRIGTGVVTVQSEPYSCASLQKMGENCTVPEGTRSYSLSYPALRIRLRAGLN